MATAKLRKIGGVVRLKCPNCGKDSVFHRTRYPFISRPEMKEACENCGYRFHREPGFFKGAMYFSYLFAIVEGIIAFLVADFLIYGISATNQFLISLAAIFFLAMWNYRLARVVWLNLFPG